jgi:hypothetical protein
MKLTKETLKRIIKEELEHVLGESNLLNKLSKSREDEFRKYISDAGKDPDAVIASLGPQSADVMRSSFYSDHPPRKLNYQTLDEALEEYGWTYKGASYPSRKNDEVQLSWQSGEKPHKSFTLKFWYKPKESSIVQPNTDRAPLGDSHVLVYWFEIQDGLYNSYFNKREAFPLEDGPGIDFTDHRTLKGLKAFAFNREQEGVIEALEKLR